MQPNQDQEGTSPKSSGRRKFRLRNFVDNPRLAVAAVGLLGGVALILGTIHLARTITGPFTAQTVNGKQVARANLEKITALKNVDTDRDRLSDFDELYRYHTSPFLSDTDSDGRTDSAEVQGGSDPNCPLGRTCGGLTTGGTGTATNTAPGNANATGQNTNAVAAALSGSLSADELRRLLAGSGAPQYVLDATSDADLLTLYRQTLQFGANTNGSPNQNGSPANTNAAIDASSLAGLSADDIRTLLTQNGVDASALTGVDDDTLKNIFLQSLSEVQQQQP